MENNNQDVPEWFKKYQEKIDTLEQQIEKIKKKIVSKDFEVHPERELKMEKWTYDEIPIDFGTLVINQTSVFKDFEIVKKIYLSGENPKQYTFKLNSENKFEFWEGIDWVEDHDNIMIKRICKNLQKYYLILLKDIKNKKEKNSEDFSHIFKYILTLDSSTYEKSLLKNIYDFLKKNK